MHVVGVSGGQSQAVHPSGLALSAVSLTGIPAFAPRAGEPRVPSLRIERFVFDARFAAAVELARHAASRHASGGNVRRLTDLWCSDSICGGSRRRWPWRG